MGIKNLEIMSSKWQSQRLLRLTGLSQGLPTEFNTGHKQANWGQRERELHLGLSNQGHCFITCVPRKITDEERSEKIGLPLDHPDLIIPVLKIKWSDICELLVPERLFLPTPELYLLSLRIL